MRPATSTPLLAGKTVLFVVFEFPSLGTAGYHTYNRSVLAALLAQGAHVHLQVLTRRYKALHHDLAEIAEVTVSAPGLWVWRGQAWVWGPLAYLRWLASRVTAQTAHTWSNAGSHPPQARPGDQPPQAHASGIASMGRWCSPAQAAVVQARARALRPDLTLVDTLFCAPLAGTLNGRLGRCPTVVVAHDVFSQRTRELLRVGLQPRPLVDEAMEREALSRADGVIAISETDAVALRLLLADGAEQQGTREGTGSLALPPTPVHTLPPDLALQALPDPTAQGASTSAPPGPPCLFYMGSAAHHNVHAMHWFLHQVWPLLRLREPRMELVLAGDVGSAWVHQALPGVRVLGRVADPVQAAAGCTLAIEPAQAGSGVKIKMLSYLALGLPCVTTPAGAQGLQDFAAALHVAEGPQAFCDAVLATLASLKEAAPGTWQRSLHASAAAQRSAAQRGLAQWLLPLMARATPVTPL